MKIGEAKLRLSKGAINIIDAYFGESTLNEKFINSTLKILVKQNLYKVEPILEMFADKDGEINASEILAEYANIIDDNGYVFDIKSFVKDDIVKALIPDKALLIKREDILKILS